MKDRPLEGQGPLFSILGDGPGQIGVRLSESYIMTPIKSGSGVLFPSQVPFEDCELCPQRFCPNRRAPYDPELSERRYASMGRQDLL